MEFVVIDLQIAGSVVGEIPPDFLVVLVHPDMRELSLGSPFGNVDDDVASNHYPLLAGPVLKECSFGAL